MSILLYVAGALFVAIGAALIGFGIPINEFSFGNTLIIAGMVAMVGGLIVLALGIVVRELRYLADMYGRASTRAPKPSDADSPPLPGRAALPSAAARLPFPPKPKSAPPAETLPREPAVSFAPEPREELPPSHDELPPPFPIRRPVTPPVAPPVVAAPVPRPQEEVFGAPSLPNPAETSDFDRLDRFHPSEARAEEHVEEAAELAEAGEWDDAEKRGEATEPVEPEPPVFTPPRSRVTAEASTDKPERSYFDAMWPAEPEAPKGTKTPDVKALRVEASVPVPEPSESEVEQEEPPIEEPRAVPILKSGVVDGMGYTLYVDGSIEAELPQGTLRFASINELRAHLEKTS